MQIVTIHTAQNVQIDYPVAGVLDRIIAFLIDLLILGAYGFIVFFVFATSHLMEDWLMILFYLPVFFYHLVTEITMDGQSLGKRAIRLKVVRLDGTNPTIGNYVLRWILRLIDIQLAGSVAITFILITRNGQRLGDLAAGTTVVKLTTPGDVTGHNVIRHMEENYTPVFPQVIQLADRDIDIIKQALEVNRTMGNMDPVLKLDQKLKTLLGIETDMAPVKFLYTIIRDYSHLTAAT